MFLNLRAQNVLSHFSMSCQHCATGRELLDYYTKINSILYHYVPKRTPIDAVAVASDGNRPCKRASSSLGGLLSKIKASNLAECSETSSPLGTPC